MDWKKYSFVIRGLNRKRVLLALSSHMTPTQLKEKTNTSLSHVSHALSSLQGVKLVECINPSDRVGKIYRRTKTGNEIAKHLEKN